MKGHEEKIKEQDYIAWLFNQYTLSAVSTAIENNFAGKKAKSKYVEKPFLQEVEEKQKEKNMTEEERIEGVKTLFARLGNMQKAFEK